MPVGRRMRKRHALISARLAKMLRFRLPRAVLRRCADLVAVPLLFALTVVAAWGLLSGETVVGMDAATQYYPLYSFLGESLRSGDIPAWNPHQFSGMPFAADPLSGWTYLPVMLFFTFLSLAVAAKGYVFFHLLLAGLSAYALARALGIGVGGASLAAVAYGYSGFIYLQSTCCFPYVAVASWLPLALLGVEMAVRGSRWMERVPWWGVSGLALSQILAAWLGQGSYYALLALGGYVAYRTLLAPLDRAPSVRGRLLEAALHGGAVLAIGFGLAAAGVLPRLEYNALSNLAGGYPVVGGDQAETVGGWAARDWRLVLEPGHWYAGVVVMALALAAPVLAAPVVQRRLAVPFLGEVRPRVLPILAAVARGRFAVPYFAALSFGAFVLSLKEPTPLHSALYLLPRIDQLHPHSPERVMVVFYLGVAILAGAALTSLKERAGRRPILLVLPVLAALLLAATVILSLLSEGGESIPVGPLLASIPALALVAAYTLVPDRLKAWRNLVLALLILVVFADLLAADRATIAEERYATEGGAELDLASYYSPSDTGRFLQSREEAGELFRYFGYDPHYSNAAPVSNPTHFTNPLTLPLEVNNRAMALGLQSIQGYNPVRISRYDEYMRALNSGVEQFSHHFADVYDEDLDSPLLDLLNARYVVVPAEEPPENQAGLQNVVHTPHQTVYEDDQSKLLEGRFRVLENEGALPRAWIVHSARQVRSKEEALDLLSVGQVDPKGTALLEEEPPEMSQPDDVSTDRAEVVEYEADQMRLKTSTGAPGLLVLSEVYYPAWKAYVDGSSVPVYPTDHLLRSVSIPAGEHTVELRYESWTLRAGVAISLATCASFGALAVAAVVMRRRRKRVDKELAGKG